ncbi:MAG: hypothetical protein AB7P21_17185 [Lautropia sp.]
MTEPMSPYADRSHGDFAAQADSLERDAMRRNRFEYVAGLVSIALLALAGTTMIATGEDGGVVASGAGHLLVAGGIATVLLRLYRRSPPAAGMRTKRGGADRLAARLETERELLGSAWRWYVAPIVPGFLLVYGGLAFSEDANRAVIVGGATFTAGVLGWVVALNRRASHRMARRLEHLSALRSSGRSGAAT